MGLNISAFDVGHSTGVVMGELIPKAPWFKCKTHGVFGILKEKALSDLWDLVYDSDIFLVEYPVVSQYSSQSHKTLMYAQFWKEFIGDIQRSKKALQQPFQCKVLTPSTWKPLAKTNPVKVLSMFTSNAVSKHEHDAAEMAWVYCKFLHKLQSST